MEIRLKHQDFFGLACILEAEYSLTGTPEAASVQGNAAFGVNWGKIPGLKIRVFSWLCCIDNTKRDDKIPAQLSHKLLTQRQKR